MIITIAALFSICVLAFAVPPIIVGRLAEWLYEKSTRPPR